MVITKGLLKLLLLVSLCLWIDSPPHAVIFMRMVDRLLIGSIMYVTTYLYLIRPFHSNSIPIPFHSIHKAEKADEANRKRAEKAALLASEEESMSSIKPKKVPTTKSTKKKTDFSLLEDALVGNAEKKVKADKRALKLKKEREERMNKEREVKKMEEMKAMDPLFVNTNSMIGDHMGGQLNASLVKGEVDASGVDAALSALSVKGEEEHPEKRMKALHKAFEERMLPEMKEEYPGLKRSQYMEKIFAIWKKSPENPMNRMA